MKINDSVYIISSEVVQSPQAADLHRTQAGLWRHLPVRSADFPVAFNRKEFLLAVERLIY